LAGAAKNEVIETDRFCERLFKPLDAFSKPEKDLNATKLAHEVWFLFLACPGLQFPMTSRAWKRTQLNVTRRPSITHDAENAINR
jgi:hypothetical protein